MNREIKLLFPVNPEGLDKIARELLNGSIPVNQPKNTNFSLEDLTDFYRINGVQYRNNTYTVDLSKSLLDNEASKTQDQWVEYSKEAIAKNDFYLGDFPLYHSLFTALFRNKDKQHKQKIEKVREFLKDNLFKHWLMTLTRIKYKEQ